MTDQMPTTSDFHATPTESDIEMVPDEWRPLVKQAVKSMRGMNSRMHALEARDHSSDLKSVKNEERFRACQDRCRAQSRRIEETLIELKSSIRMLFWVVFGLGAITIGVTSYLQSSNNSNTNVKVGNQNGISGY